MDATNIARHERAIRFFQHANTAAAESLRLRREPFGGPLSALRREDARGLRAVARETLRP